MYMSDDALMNSLTERKDIFKVLSLNCQSLYAKFDQLYVLIEKLRRNGNEFDAICLQETWIDDNMDTSLLHLPSYNLISKTKTTSLHGGLAIYIKNCYRYTTVLSEIDNFSTWEHQFIEIETDNNNATKIIIGNIYRLPRETSDDYKMFIDEMSQVLGHFQQNARDVILFGDFNIDLLKISQKAKANDFFEFMLSLGYIPKITLPTRLSETSATLIDNIYCKLSHNFSKTLSGILTSRISDHQAYFICLDYLKMKNSETKKYIKIYKYDNTVLEKFKADLKALSIDKKFNYELDADPDGNYNILEKAILDLKERHFTAKTVRFDKYKHKKNSWITRGILNSIKFRDKLYVKLKKTSPNTSLYNTLKINLSTYNKILKENIKQAKNIHYHKLFENCKKDIKRTWMAIKELINKNKNTKKITNLFLIDGQSVTNPEIVANNFNRYFNEIGPSTASKIVPPPYQNFTDFLSNPNESLPEFSFKSTTEAAILKIIENLPSKTSKGIDGISVKFIKEIKDIVVKPLTIIINQSLHVGKFPSKLKIAKIVPIFKKDNEQLIENYRPISVLPAMSKVFEKVMFTQLYDYFTVNNILYRSQYGFRQGHNTELAALENIDRVVDCLESGKIPINIFLDLSKAFDTLDHRLLLHKLSHYGIRNKALNLCASYLTDRKQCVNYDGYFSNLLNISTGVPQGSILGPLFFLIYLNDFDRSTNKFRFITYADDTTLVTSLCLEQSTSLDNEQNTSPDNEQSTSLDNEQNTSLDNEQITSLDNEQITSLDNEQSTSLDNEQSTPLDNEQVLNCELNKVCCWLKTNKLSLNAKKTKFMMFYPINKEVPKLNLKIDGDQIECVNTFDFLGITFDSHLSWKPHVEKIGKKISKTLAILNRLKHYIPTETLLILYNSLISSHLLYGILLWGKKLSSIAQAQKKAIRLITRSRYNAHTDPLFKKLNILKVSDLLTVQEWKFYYKLVHKKLPLYFLQSAPLLRHSYIHHYQTRHNNNILIPKLKYQFSFSSIKTDFHNLLTKQLKMKTLYLKKYKSTACMGSPST